MHRLLHTGKHIAVSWWTVKVYTFVREIDKIKETHKLKLN